MMMMTISGDGDVDDGDGRMSGDDDLINKLDNIYNNII